MSAIATVYFDWGGVLADDPGDDFLSALLRKTGATDQQVEEIFKTYMSSFMCGDITEAEYWQSLREAYGFEIHESISDDFKEWRGLIVNQDVLDLVHRVKAAGYRTALLSNVIEPTYNVLAEAGHYDHFDEIIASCKVGHAKPKTEIYELALQRMDAQASESLFIDDKQRNLDPAIQMGFTTILAESPDQIIRDVSKKLDKLR